MRVQKKEDVKNGQGCQIDASNVQNALCMIRVFGERGRREMNV